MTKNTGLKTLFSNTIMLYILQISGYVFPLITFPYLTRVLGPDRYGILVFANATMTYFQLLVDFGFLLSATKECSINRGDKKKLGEIVSSVVQAKLLLVFVGFAITVILVSFVDVFAKKRLFMLFSYISVFLSIFIPDYLFRGLERMSIITYRTIIAKAIYTMLIFVIVKTPDEYLYIPIITSVGNLFVVIWTWLVITKNLQIKYRIVSFSNTIQAMKESSVFFLSRIASTAYGASNAFILGFICSGAALANFGAANTLISSARVMFSPIADSLYPYMVNKKNYKLVKMLLFILSPLILIGTIVLFIFAEPIVVLICGSEFSEAVPIFRAMLPIIPITLPLYLLGFPVLGAMGKMKEANMSVVYAAIFHMVGLGVLFAIGSLNFISVAILTCGSEAIVLTLRIFYVFIGKRGEECNEKSFKAICIKK